jgi:hypothetical protein
VNQNRPSGAPWLEPVELMVRNIQLNVCLVGSPTMVATLAQSVELPPLSDGAAAMQQSIWPPKGPPVPRERSEFERAMRARSEAMHRETPNGIGSESQVA